MRPCPENTLGYAAIIDIHENKEVLQTCILRKRGSLSRFAVSISRSLVRLTAFVKGKLRNILHHESRSTGFIRNEPCRN